MPELTFAVESVEAAADSIAPLLLFRLRVKQAGQHDHLAPIHTVALRCQIRIEPAKRQYEIASHDRLRDLFDTPDRWGQTLRPMVWTHVTTMLPAFTESVVAELPVPCTYDFNVAATKYFYAIETGEIPLNFLFSGTIFHEAPSIGLQAAPIPWDREASCRLPALVWREMMDRYYPNTAWLNLRRDVFDRLAHYKSQQSLPTFERALESLLAADRLGDRR